MARKQWLICSNLEQCGWYWSEVPANFGFSDAATCPACGEKCVSVYRDPLEAGYKESDRIKMKIVRDGLIDA